MFYLWLGICRVSFKSAASAIPKILGGDLGAPPGREKFQNSPASIWLIKRSEKIEKLSKIIMQSIYLFCSNELNQFFWHFLQSNFLRDMELVNCFPRVFRYT